MRGGSKYSTSPFQVGGQLRREVLSLLLINLLLILNLLGRWRGVEGASVVQPPTTPDPIKSTPPSHRSLIEEGSAWFPSGDSLQGYEVLIRHYNHSVQATVYVSQHMADHTVIHPAADDTHRPLVILAPPSQSVPYKEVTTYLVLRQATASSDRYTSHLAYVRKFGEDLSLEWDVYSFHFHNPNGSFISALFPGRGGPDTVSPGKGPQRLKRRGDWKGRRMRRDADIPLKWSWHTTEGPPTVRLANLPPPLEEPETATEYPMFGDTGGGTGLDENGFTTLPPWSQFRHFTETTEMPNPFQSETISPLAAQKKPCFGLARNCVDKPVETGGGAKKACAFGYRCKDSSFVDRYAVASTTTDAPDLISVIDGSTAGEGKGKKKKKKKKKKKTKEECEAEEGEAKSKHTRSVVYRRGPPSSQKPQTKDYSVQKGGTPQKSPVLNITSSSKSKAVQNTGGGKKVGGGQKELTTSQKLQPAQKEISVKKGVTVPQGRAAQYVFHIENIVCKGGLKCDVTKEGKKWGGVASDDDDPCAEYRTAPSAGESEMRIEEGEGKPSTSLSDLVKKKSGGGGGGGDATAKEGEIQPPTPTPFPKSPGLAEGMKMFIPPGDDGEQPPAVNQGYGKEGFDHNKAAEEEGKTFTKKEGLQAPPPAPSGRSGGRQVKGRRVRSPSQASSVTTGLMTTNSILPPGPHHYDDEESLPSLPSSSSVLEVEEGLLGAERSRGSNRAEGWAKLPFLGLGQCPYLKVNEGWRPRGSEDLINFYLQVLQVNCLPNFKEETKRLFLSKLVVADEVPFRILLNQSHPLLGSRTVGEFEWLDVASAIFLSALSSVYADQREGRVVGASPSGEPVSANAASFAALTLGTLEVARRMPWEAVKLGNVLLIVLQAQRSELNWIQDELEREDCPPVRRGECRRETSLNFNDQLLLNSLMRFVVEEMGEVVGGEERLGTTFHNFYLRYSELNVQRVKNKVPFVF